MKIAMQGKLACAILLFALLPPTGPLGASVFDDAAIWIRGFRDADGDGRIGIAADVPDARSACTAIPCTLYGSASNRHCRAENVVCPYAGRTMSAVPCCYLPQPVDEAGLGVFGSFAVLNSGKVAVTNGVSTVVARIRPEAPLMGTTVWLTGGIGSQIGFTLQENGTLRIRGYAGGGYRNCNFYAETNVWMDVAIVCDATSCKIYAVTNGSAFFSQSFSVANGESEYGDFYFGYTSSGLNYATAKRYASYRGSIHQLALWNRALSEREVREAFAFPANDIFRVGLVDGTAGEAGRDLPGGEAANADDWHSAPAMLPADTSASYVFTADATTAALPQLLRLTATSASASGTFAVIVNGKALAPLSSLPGRTAVAFVPTNVLCVGANTLTLTRQTAGVTWVDALELGGSFQLGVDDDAYAEFGSSGNPAYAEDGNWKHVATAVGRESTNTVSVLVPASVAAAQNGWLLEVKAFTPYGLGHYETPPEAGLMVNGSLLMRESYSDVRYKTFAANMPAGTLRAGENTLSFVNFTPLTTADGYLRIDFWRLSALPLPKGIAISFR